MAPIESSLRGLSIGAIGFARGHVFDKINQNMGKRSSNQIKSRGFKKASNQIKSCTQKARQIKRSKNPSKSNPDFIFAHPCSCVDWTWRRLGTPAPIHCHFRNHNGIVIDALGSILINRIQLHRFRCHFVWNPGFEILGYEFNHQSKNISIVFQNKINTA